MTKGRKLAAVAAILAMVQAWLSAAVAVNRRKGQRVADDLVDANRSPVHRAANAGTVITVVVLGVVALVGVLIFAQVQEATPELSSNESDENYSPLAGSQDSIVDGFGSAVEFIPIIMLVLLASVVIMVVQRMRN